MRENFPLRNCPLTGMEIKDNTAQRDFFDKPGVYYKLKYEGEEYYLGICDYLYDLLTKDKDYLERNGLLEKSGQLKRYLPTFFGELGKSNYKELFNRTIHLDCNIPETDSQKHLIIKQYTERAYEKGVSIKTRKEKANLILKTIRNTQSFAGEKIQMMNEFKYWGKCYLSNSKEFEYYLTQLESEGYVQIGNPFVWLTFKGLDYTENLETMPIGLKAKEMHRVDLSFIGEERDFVDDLVPKPITMAKKVFISYSHKDESFKDDLDTHFSALRRSGLVDVWHDRRIDAGTEWDDAIKSELESADIILLLVSADFLASEYIWKVEIARAMERHRAKEAKVIPIFTRSCDVKGVPFEGIQGLPRDAKPIATFTDKDEAYVQIAKGVRAILET